MPISFLTGERGLRRQRDSARSAIIDLYNPQQLSPQLEYAQRQASEGIGRAGQVARQQGLSSLFAPETNLASYGGNQARAVAGTQAVDRGRSRAMSELEGRLSQADIQARQRGDQMTAHVRGQQAQIAGQRDAQLHQADMMYEAERGRRRQALGGTVLGALGTIASTPFGGGSSLVARGLTSLFGADDHQVNALERLESRNAAREQMERNRAMEAPENELIGDPVDVFGDMDFSLGEMMDVPQAPELDPNADPYPQVTELLRNNEEVIDLLTYSNETLPDLQEELSDEEFTRQNIISGQGFTPTGRAQTPFGSLDEAVMTPVGNLLSRLFGNIENFLRTPSQRDQRVRQQFNIQ